MCTVIILNRPGHDWPVLIAANRDERLSRPWQPPGRHWPDRPSVLAGYDVLRGGSWIGLNDSGVFAVVLNRRGTLGPAPDKLSRGDLVLRALEQASAAAAAHDLAGLDPEAYRPFNMVIADRRDVFWLARRDGAEAGDDGRGAAPAPDAVYMESVPAGFHMIAADDMDDPRSPRLARLPLFQTVPAPDPLLPETWQPWERLLADSHYVPDDGPIGALCVVTDRDYGTVSASLLALPAADRADLAPVWRFAPGRPGRTAFRSVDRAPRPPVPADQPID
ncbi:MAG: hypothetical protein GVY13_07215 [Alphaproteobacteria bacterium]|jgi:hypothetical protein|nr:hypothetical protein [Alphaproteobacteria bacterium]